MHQSFDQSHHLGDIHKAAEELAGEGVAAGDGDSGASGGWVGLHQASDEPGEHVWMGVHEQLAQHGGAIRVLDFPICKCGFRGLGIQALVKAKDLR